MIEIVILLLLPSCLSVIICYGLDLVSSRMLKLSAPFVLFALSLILWTVTIRNFGDMGIIAVSAWFITIAIAVSCAVAIGMNIFPPGLGKKRDAVIAFISPFISIPFLFMMFITPEMVIGQAYPDYFFSKRLPLSGWIIDALTASYEFTAGGESILPGILLNIGFFIEMIIVMVLLFWVLKTVMRVYDDIPT
ncbi:MAG: hypothetical protein JW931_03020 [Methanomicrobiaceae archaeon]|nr:hypothetical protein [Methanomicrobiaceae archaeon]